MATTIAGVFLLLLGLGTAYLATTYGVGGMQSPGPGFFPLLVGVFLAVLALFYLYQERGQQRFQGGVWLRPLQAIILSFAYVMVLERLGYIISTILMLLVFVGGIERQKVGRTVAVALLGTAGMYLVFAVWLRVPLPQGLLAF